MAINIIDPEVPRVLPHARLYLDGIEQIVNILSGVERKVVNATPGTPQPPQPTFRVGNKETHEIEDLTQNHDKNERPHASIGSAGPHTPFPS